MLGLFKRSQLEVSLAESLTPEFIQERRRLTEQKAIKEVHDSYDAAAEKLLNEAKAILGLGLSQDKNKLDRMAKLGFNGSRAGEELKKELQVKFQAETLAKLIQYYQTNYPNYKFITREVVAEINKKYGLVCIPARRYKGDIPEKNLLEIESFNVKAEDCLYISRKSWRGQDSAEEMSRAISEAYYDGRYYMSNHISLEEATPRIKQELIEHQQQGFFISCPQKDADLEGMRVDKDGFAFTIEKDPIVLKPVKGGYLVVTKWGLEGQDETLVNEKMN